MSTLTGNTATFGGGVANEAGATSGGHGFQPDRQFGNQQRRRHWPTWAWRLCCTIACTGNTAASGGGIWNSITGTLSILGPNGSLGGDTTIANNSATVGDGGGIDNYGSVTIGDSDLDRQLGGASRRRRR